MGDVHRLIAFDLDGTLIDSRRDLAESANQLIVELGGSALSIDAVGRMIGEGARVLVERALEASGLASSPAALARFLQIYDTRLLDHTQPYPGIVDALRCARTHARLVVLTNKPRGPSEQILSAFGLREWFDDVIGGDGPFPRKPDPAGLLSLINSAGAVAETTLMVGDSVIDLDTARRASARCCLAGYGFGYLTCPSERLTGGEWVVRAPSDLPAVFEQFVSGERSPDR